MTQEEMDQHFKEAHEEMTHAIEHLIHELGKIRTGKASTSMVNEILVPYYGSPTPLNQVANVNTTDARTIAIQPWEKTLIGAIEKAIFEANLGITPMNNGEQIILGIPPLTEERRKDLVKQAKNLGEEAKISIRSTRHKLMETIKKAVKDHYPEDMGKRREAQVQEMVNEYSAKADHAVEIKDADIMTV
jgi:ribosome recycling factor